MDPVDVQGQSQGEVCSSLRERSISENSLVALLQGMQGHVTTVELRDEGWAQGRLQNVDAFMNLRMRDVLYRGHNMGHTSKLQDLFITGRNIRFVHIPDHMDVLQTIQTQLQRIHRVRTFNREGGGGGRREYCPKKK
ncbi:unnamed protein product [Knipowitschia caucasica]|uniref:Sm domain-containing protein n=1 Tax=Knipowitschia caucasica TaxID=637954 RepID=A0AAV2LKB8_KNICA